MISWSNLYSERSRHSHSNLVSDSSSSCIQLSAGYPDPRLFPLQEVGAIVAGYAEANDRSVLQYNAPGGFEPLKEVIASKSRQTLPENILLTHGSQQGLDLISKILLNPGDTVIVEAPTFHGALWVFEAAEANVVQIPMDAEGMNTEYLEFYLRSHPRDKPPKLIYTIPTFHNPTGKTMSLERRLELIRISGQYGIPIIEDAPYSQLWFDQEPPPALLELGGAQQLIYLGTFSKTLCPSLRVGWIAASPAVISKCLHFKHIADTCSNGFIQQIVHNLHLNGFLDRNIVRAQQIYRSKRNALIEAIKEIGMEELQLQTPEGGLFAWLELGDRMPGELLQAEARKQNVLIAASPMFYANGSNAPSACRITFSYPTEADIARGFQILANILRTHK